MPELCILSEYINCISELVFIRFILNSARHQERVSVAVHFCEKQCTYGACALQDAVYTY